MKPKHLIIAPPPTPNGDLHVGHLSGPYLGADIYKRLMTLSGVPSYYSVSTDDYQTYVDTSAARKKMTPQDLIARSRAEIVRTLKTYDIDIDRFGEQDATYAECVKSAVERLHAAGAVEIREIPVLFDPE